MKTNYYRLTKKELSFIRHIQAPVLSTRGVRLSRPVVLVYLGGNVLYIWTLAWFRDRVKRGLLPAGLTYDICSLYKTSRKINTNFSNMQIYDI